MDQASQTVLSIQSLAEENRVLGDWLASLSGDVAGIEALTFALCEKLASFPAQADKSQPDVLSIQSGEDAHDLLLLMRKNARFRARIECIRLFSGELERLLLAMSDLLAQK